MKVPPFIIGVALLFWGYETETLLISAILALIVEGAALVNTRYTLTHEDFIKISDVTSLIFIGSVALILLNYKPTGFLRITASWLPFILSPLILAQLYSTSDKIIIGTRLEKKRAPKAHKPLDFRPYFLTACIFAAAAGNSRSLWFYPVLAIIVVWLLFQNRGRSYSPLSFFLLILISLGLSYTTIQGMEKAQRILLKKSHHLWRSHYRGQHHDPFKSTIRFGEIGRLKQSDEIIMRVDASSIPPVLFKLTSYSLFNNKSWFGQKTDFTYLPFVTENQWNLLPPPHKQGKSLTIQYHLPKEKGLLPYPDGGYLLKSNTIFDIEANSSGTLKIIDGASTISYDLLYHPKMQPTMDLPGPRNLDVPKREVYALQQVIEQLGVSDGSDNQKIAAMAQFFQNNFTYSLEFIRKENSPTPLGNFLLHRKSGFCEYYATATTLLLRFYGIPSRYVVGYGVTEKSWLEKKYVVRQKHAHAWSEAFIDNQWRVVDNTPADWTVKENEQFSLLTKPMDIFYYLRNQYRLYRVGSGADNSLIYSIIVVLLTTFLALRIYRRMKVEQADASQEQINLRSFESIISPFTPIMKTLIQAEEKRGEQESFIDWVIRLNIWPDLDPYEFETLYHLHLKMRFDPTGLSDQEQEQLRRGSSKYLAETKQN